jgi:hypothetical protein
MARFACSVCAGTFDQTQGSAKPTCAKGGEMVSVPVTTKPATGCYSYEKFIAKKFTKTHFVPRTGRGKFDCAYDPVQGVLDITVKIDVSSPGGKIEQDELLRLAGIFRGAVPGYWDGKWAFKCTRKGWEGVAPVRARFHVDVQPSHLSHFSLILSQPAQSKGPKLPSYMRECRGFVSLRQITVGPGEKDRVELQDFHVQDFYHVLASQIIAQHERQRLQEAMGFANPHFAQGSKIPQSSAFTLSVPVKRGGKTEIIKTKVIALITDEESEAFRNMNRRILGDFARFAAQALPGSPPIPVIVSPPGSPIVHGRENWTEHVKGIVSILKEVGLRNPVEIGDPIPEAVTVTLRIDEELERQELENLRYNVAAHEFGHMIGLPDEYENPVASVQATAEDNAKAIVKGNFLDLVRRAGFFAPEFPSHTSSMMSDGMTVMDFHSVTVWDALCAMTRHYVGPKEWRVLPC